MSLSSFPSILPWLVIEVILSMVTMPVYLHLSNYFLIPSKPILLIKPFPCHESSVDICQTITSHSFYQTVGPNRDARITGRQDIREHRNGVEKLHHFNYLLLLDRHIVGSHGCGFYLFKWTEVGDNSSRLHSTINIYKKYKQAHSWVY